MPISPARVAAFEILLRIVTTDAYASELLHSSRFEKLSPADHGLLTEVVMGALRWRGVLDSEIATHSSQSLARLDTEVLTALRLGAYQLLFLDRIPAHAAVHDSVELVKQAHKRSAAGLVNAVLRKIKRRQSDLNPREAHPEWLVDRWEKSYGPDAARRICEYNQSTPRTAIRISGASPEQTLGKLRAGGIQLEAGQFLSGTIIVQSGDVTKTAAFRERLLMIQDEASQLVAFLVGHGNSILDCCAAPGGKTRIIAERNSDSTVMAVDLHPRRAALLKKLVANENVQVISADVRQLPLTAKFDRVLVDAPCSGTGTMARNPEIKWRLGSDDITRLQQYQIQILRAALQQVGPGGRLVYSTCSLEPEENEVVVEQVLAEEGSFRVVDCREEMTKLQAVGELSTATSDSLLRGPYLRTIPGVHACDGFFAAMLEKTQG